MPNHQYARLAEQCLELWKSDPMDKFAQEILQVYTASTRAYTRIVLRLRAQAEAAEAEYVAQQIVQASSSNGPVSAFSMANGNFSSNQSRSYSRPPSRAPSPAMSMFSSAHHTQTAVNHTTGSAQANTTQHRGASFRSPLFKLRRAPLLRVFVPSPDGDWLSDASVLECEAQLKAAGVLKLLRSGDVVWDVAVGDESNIGRLVWDRNFLIVSVIRFLESCTRLSSNRNNLYRILTTLTLERAIFLSICILSPFPRPTSIESYARVQLIAPTVVILSFTSISVHGARRLPRTSNSSKIECGQRR